VLINKVDTAAGDAVEIVRRNVRDRKPRATVIEADCRIVVSEAERIYGGRVLVVEDGLTLTHGVMSFGAGVVAARQYGAAEIVDPRPYAMGSLRETFDRFRHIGHLLPAMGYSQHQLVDLEATIRRTPCDVVLVATPVDLSRIIPIEQRSLRVGYEVQERGSVTLADLVASFVARRSAVMV